MSETIEVEGWEFQEDGGSWSAELKPYRFCVGIDKYGDIRTELGSAPTTYTPLWVTDKLRTLAGEPSREELLQRAERAEAKLAWVLNRIGRPLGACDCVECEIARKLTEPAEVAGEEPPK